MNTLKKEFFSVQTFGDYDCIGMQLVGQKKNECIQHFGLQPFKKNNCILIDKYTGKTGSFASNFI